MPRRSSRRLFCRPTSSSLSGMSLPASTSQLASKRSFLAKPPAPGAARRVLAVLRDGQKRRGRTPNDSSDPVQVNSHHPAPATRTHSVLSSLQSAGEPPAAGERLIEVDASEVSDGSSSGRARRRSSGSDRRGGVEDALRYDDESQPEEDGGDDGAGGFLFRLVGEDDVPEAPPASAVDAERVRALLGELEVLRKEKRDMEAVFAQQHRELNVLVNAMKTRAAESSIEVEDLTRQLKETRKRLTRRVRELEEELGKQRTGHAEEVARHRGVEKELRAEVDALRGNAQCFVRTESTPALPARRKRASVAVPPGHHFDTTRGAAPESVSSGGNSAQGLDFARVRSAGNVHETLRRKTSRPDVYHSRVRSSGLAKRASNASGEVGRKSPRVPGKRSLLRRSFIAHIHSTRYRTTRSAWQEFLGAENTQVTPEQFARAVRSLAIASDARDRDLELLREEVCGAELGDTGVVTWEMFVRFYQRTKHEST